MVAIDTNLVIRYLTGDHPRQSEQARALIDGTDVFVCTTVLLETEWFYAASMDIPLVGSPGHCRPSPGFRTSRLKMVATALDLMERGLDFADVLHLARAAGCEAFVTFDRRFARMANKLGFAWVRAPG